MEYLRKLIAKISGNPIARNLVLAFCAIIVFGFVANLLLNLFTRHGQIREVPDLSGMTIDEAKHAGKGASLRIEINDSLYVPAYPGGVILEQNPEAGAKVKSGRRVFVTINSYNQKMVTIPYVTGYSLRQAKSNLEMAGLEIDKLIYQSDLATNNVLEERYNGRIIRPGNKVQAEMGSGITLVVGLGSEDAVQAVPRLAGFSAREAKSRLWEAGFNVGRIKRDAGINLLNEKEAHVCAQSPAAGTRLGLGTPVDFTLTLDEKKIEEGHKQADRSMRAAAKAHAEAADSTAKSK